MINSSLFLIFAQQKLPSSFFVQTTSVSLFRDFSRSQLLNGPISAFRKGPSFSFNRNSFATYFNSTGILETVSVNTPRFEYEPLTGNFKGLLIEDQKTNLVQTSTSFTGTVWTTNPNTLTITSNIPTLLAPDNTQTVTLLRTTNSNTFHITTWDGTPAPFENDPNPVIDYYDRSIFVKKEKARYLLLSCSEEPSATAGGGQVNYDSISNIFDFDLPGFTQFSTIEPYFIPLNNGWYRIGFNRLSSNREVNRFTIGISSGPNYEDLKFSSNLNDLSGVYVWGAQVEKGRYPTSYIPTAGTEVTRAADNVFIGGAGFNQFYNLSGGVFFTKVNRYQNYDSSAFATFINDNKEKYITLGTNSLSGDVHILTNTANPSTLQSDTVTTNTFYNIAINLDENNFIFYQNNTKVASLSEVGSNLPQPPSRLTTFELGQFNNTNYLNGHVQVLGYIPTPLTTQQLSAFATLSAI